jgi:RecA-family ATPase
VTTPTTPNFIKATDLLAKEMPDLHWAVPGIWPQGLALLSGKPKIGKTFFITNLGIASASGGRALGQIQVEARDTLMLLLEDTERRVRSRLLAQLGDEPCPKRLTITTTWPRLDQGGEKVAHRVG